MSRRGAQWPTWLWFDPEFGKLTAPAQRLFVFLWMHPDLNSAGFIALQPEVWSRTAYELTPEDVDASVDELLARNWVVVDDETGELWVRPFVRLDAIRKPYIWIAATRAVQTCRSHALRLPDTRCRHNGHREPIPVPPPECWPTPAAFNEPLGVPAPLPSELRQQMRNGEAVALKRLVTVVAGLSPRPAGGDRPQYRDQPGHGR
jgi:hypothetical protein